MRHILIIALLITGSAFSQEDEEIVDFPDVECQFPGGPNEMKKFIQKNIVYPDSALILWQSGRVYIEFVVEKDGSLSNLKVKRSTGSHHLDNAGLDVIMEMPNWQPGKYHGNTVRTRCRLPITFTLDSGKKEEIPEKKKWWKRG